MAEVLTFRRPRIHDATQDPNASSGKQVNAQHLLVRVDLDEDGRRREVIKCREADYSGIISEYTTGTATTILDSSVGTELGGVSDREYLTATQESFLGTTKSWPAP